VDPARPVGDPSVGQWVLDRLLDPHEGVGLRVGAVVPTGFRAVVRVLHPPGDGRTWAQVARDAGRTLHPLAQWGSIAPHVDGSGRSGDVDPEEGSVPPATLAAILEHCPAEGHLWYAVWDGWGSWVDEAPEAALLHSWGGRDYRVFTGPAVAVAGPGVGATGPGVGATGPGVAATGPGVGVPPWPGMAALHPQSASLVWPGDRSWCVATEIDLDSTLVAGPARLAAALLGDDRLEAFAVGYDDDLGWFGDRVNPAPEWLRRLQDEVDRGSRGGRLRRWWRGVRGLPHG
jgi:hypothetical protein